MNWQSLLLTYDSEHNVIYFYFNYSNVFNLCYVPLLCIPEEKYLLFFFFKKDIFEINCFDS